MKGDFSRFTFAEGKHYRRVLTQQGRVQLDADSNEQVAIDQHLATTTSTDVIGQAGYPDGPTGGFLIGLDAGATDLTISPGRMYVDGLMVENDGAAATLLNQPSLPGATLASLGVTQAGSYVAYLDVWERLITALDDPGIRESALGGPDTSARTQLVWQVKLAFLQAPPAAGDTTPLPTCSTAAQPWLAAAGTGMLAASSGATAVSLPCVLPPESGFQQLENQLYRVEVHNPGPAGTATFKWSRENGSVVALITAPPTAGGAVPPTTVTGTTFSVQSLNQDPSLGLQAGDWVELIDDQTELTAGHGDLYQVAATPTDGQTVSVTLPAAATAPTLTLALHPKLRRWDQSGTGLGSGITIDTTTPIALEGGVQVQFSAGNYATGDYWLIPARTATSVAQGFVEWPVDTGNAPVPMPALGITHHYAQLGLVEFTPPGTFGGLGTATSPTDCRLPFRPLVELMPAQSLSPCTIVVTAGAGWEAPILAYFAAAKPAQRLDAEICFPIGDFPVTTPIVITGAGHLRINGAGWGTRLSPAPGNTAAASLVSFVDCSSVAVRDLFAATTTPVAANGTGQAHINGTLSFANCPEVTVEDVWLRCLGAVSARGAACISVTTDVTAANVTTGAGSVRIRGCLLHVGEMQVGVQLSHQLRACVEDNEIMVDPTIPVAPLGVRLADVGYLAIARSYLISGVSASAAAPSPAPTATPAAEPAATAAAEEPKAGAATGRVRKPAAGGATAPGPVDIGVITGIPAASLFKAPITLTVGNQQLAAITDSGLASTWQTYLTANAPATFGTGNDAIRYLKGEANKLLTNPAARAGFSAFTGVLQTLNGHVPLAGRGIVVGGQAIGDLTITGNAVSGVLMGISVGVSHAASGAEVTAKQRTPDHMQRVRVASNVIACSTNDVAAKKARFGIFVGNANSLEIVDNRVTTSRAGISQAPAADAIRVVGYLGLKTLIRGNHTTGFEMGIRMMPLSGTGPGHPEQPPAPGPYDDGTVRAGALRLIADNAIENASATAPLGPFTKTKNGNPPQAPTPYIDAPQVKLVNNVQA